MDYNTLLAIFIVAAFGFLSVSALARAWIYKKKITPGATSNHQ